jgi:uncharacterized protein (DUF305 family)
MCIKPTPRKDQPASSRQNWPLLLLTVVAVLAASAALVLLVASQPPASDSDEAGFARDMVVHHAQAVQMAEIVRDSTKSDDMRFLTTDIALTQQAQIGIMQGWLQAWGLPITGDEPAMAWMGHPTGGLMPGRATQEEISRLSALPPDRADVLFLRLMIAHHQAAIPMSGAILARTDEPEVSRLARQVDAHGAIPAQGSDLFAGRLQVLLRRLDPAREHLLALFASSTQTQ